ALDLEGGPGVPDLALVFDLRVEGFGLAVDEAVGRLVRVHVVDNDGAPDDLDANAAVGGGAAVGAGRVLEDADAVLAGVRQDAFLAGLGGFQHHLPLVHVVRVHGAASFAQGILGGVLEFDRSVGPLGVGLLLIKQ